MNASAHVMNAFPQCTEFLDYSPEQLLLMIAVKLLAQCYSASMGTLCKMVY